MRVAASLALVAAALVVAATPLRAQPNIDSGAVLTLTAQTVGQAISSEQSNPNSSSLKCTANLTAISGGAVVLGIQGRDKASGQYINLLTTQGLTGAGVYFLTVGRGAVPTLGSGPFVANDFVPVAWRVVATVLGQSTASVTGTVGCSLI